MNLSIIGGASGIGKTSLLKQFADITQINSGDLFRDAMSNINRDKIKNGDWSIFEPDVTQLLKNVIKESFQSNSDLIIYT